MLKMKSLLLILGASVVLTSCGDPIMDVVKKNVDGLQAHDINMVMETIDRHSDVYDETKAEVERLIKNYQLEFEIESIEIIKAPRPEKAADTSDAEKQDAIREEDLAFITESERSDAQVKKEEEAVAKVNRPYEAQVKVVQVSRKTTEETGALTPFVNNRVTVIHTLRKYPTDEKPAWKIYRSEITDAQFLVAGN